MNSIPELLAIAIQHLRAGQFALADQVLESILQKQPDHPDSVHFRGIVLSKTGRHAQAEQQTRSFEKAAKLLQLDRRTVRAKVDLANDGSTHESGDLSAVGQGIAK